jgi:hypothetical protein
MEEGKDYYIRVWSNTVPNQGSFNLSLINRELRDSATISPLWKGAFDDDCGRIEMVKIDSSNNSHWVPLRDERGRLAAEINANGQNLGLIQTNGYAYNDTLRYLEGQAYLGRNVFMSAQYPPTAPIQVRYYLTQVEWDTLQAAYPSISDTTFRLIKMVGNAGCKDNLDTIGFTQERVRNATLNPVKGGYRIDFETTNLAHFFVTGIPPVEFSYPPVSFCPSAALQSPTFVGITGGTFTATPNGLTINSKTGIIYEITYQHSDFYGYGRTKAFVQLHDSIEIIHQPAPEKILTVGTPIKLTVATKGSIVGYQWQKNGVDLVHPNGDLVEEDSLIIAATSLADTGMYSVISENQCSRIVSNMSHVTAVSNGINVSVKVFLQGAFNPSTGLMTDNLRTLNLIPTVEPYTGLTNFTHVKGNSGATLPPQVLDVSASTSIVDWVFLELRAAADPSLIVATQSVLVRRNGVVVDAEGSPSVYFANVPAGNYYIAIRHRNHLGVRTANPLTFNKTIPTAFDFTATTANIYVNPTITRNTPTTTVTASGITYRALWAGDINQDGLIKYNGYQNDRALLLVKVGGIYTGIFDGYLLEDINLTGVAKYNGASNDKTIIFNNVGGVLTNFLVQHL